jgi:predicted permease
MGTIFYGLRYALRQLRKSPGFAATVILTLAVSIGANTAIFSVVDAILLRPLPYPKPERLGALMQKIGTANHVEPVKIDSETWRHLEDAVPAVQAAASSEAGGVNLETAGTGQYVHGQRVSAHYFDVLGIRPMLGRTFDDAEDTAGGSNAVILSYGIWRQAFNGDAGILGQAIRLKGVPYTVIGVLPAKASTPSVAELWTPLRPDTSAEGGGDNYRVILRLRDGATWQQANAELSHLRSETFRVLEDRSPGLHLQFYAAPLQEGLAADTRAPLMILMAAVGFILLIACANLAGLALVRMRRKEPEIATKLALGATKWAILREFWLESVVLAAMGALAALLTGSVTLELMNQRIPGEFLPTGRIFMDFRVLLFTAAVAISTSALFGLLPALGVGRIDVRSSIANRSSRSFVQTGGAQPGGTSARYALILGEVALTIVLLTMAGLLIRTLVYLETLPPGFNPANVMTAKASLDDARYETRDPFLKLLDQSVAAMRSIPGVQSAAVGLSVPYELGLNYTVGIADGLQAGQQRMTNLVYVTPGYFETLQIPLKAGRAFTEADTSTSEFVAVVNAAFARNYLGQEDATGRHVESDGNTIEVVGIVADVVKRPGLGDEAPIASEPTMYVPATQMPTQLVNLSHIWFQPSWIVRTRGPIAGVTQRMQQALASVDPSLPISGFYSMRDILAEALLFQHLEVNLLTTLAGLALLLSVVGIYGLVSSLVNQRTRELGIRMALGCSIPGAMFETSRPGIAATGAGVIAGLLLSLAAARVLRSQLFGIAANDPLTLCAVTALLAVVALVAALLPTFRIARIDPAETLRAE